MPARARHASRNRLRCACRGPAHQSCARKDRIGRLSPDVINDPALDVIVSSHTQCQRAGHDRHVQNRDALAISVAGREERSPACTSPSNVFRFASRRNIANGPAHGTRAVKRALGSASASMRSMSTSLKSVDLQRGDTRQRHLAKVHRDGRISIWDAAIPRMTTLLLPVLRI